MTKRYKIVEDSIKIGKCSMYKEHLGLIPTYHTHVVKVIDTTGKEEWRCNKHVRSLSGDIARKIAHELTSLDIAFVKKS